MVVIRELPQQFEAGLELRDRFGIMNRGQSTAGRLSGNIPPLYRIAAAHVVMRQLRDMVIEAIGMN